MLQHLPSLARSRLLCGTLSTLALLIASAAQADQYQVEMIIFRHAGIEPAHYRFEGEPDIDGALDLSTGERVVELDETLSNNTFAMTRPGPAKPARTTSITPLRTAADGIVPLLDSDLQLDHILNRLKRSSAFAPLLHLGWTQETMAFGEIQPILIEAGQVVSRAGEDSSFLLFSDRKNRTDIHEIDGTVALERSRFLHFRIDLALHALRDEQTAVEDQKNTIEFVPTGNYRSYRLEDRRQTRDGQLHYFDHPLFGVIARISKIEAD